ncbi:MAG: GNAT family N-acetyltransferase [Thermodesulfobacteriota bacterium]
MKKYTYLNPRSIKKAVLAINIETESLLLRNMNVNDVSQDYVNWLNNPEINKYLSCSNTLQTMESCLSYVRSYERKEDKALIGIFLKDKKLHIGNLTLSTIDWGRRVGIVGISLGRKEYMGQGLASEALTSLKDYCFQQLTLHRLEAKVSEQHLNSLKIFLKSGFKVEGLLRDSAIIDGEFHNGYILGVLETDL